MNKKYMMFGLLSLFAVALVSAGLVDYLSNTEEVKMTVSSPIAISEFGEIYEVYGGETQSIDTTLTNLAKAQIKGKIQVVISNNGISMNDFESLTASIVEHVPGVDDWASGDVDMSTIGGFIESIDTSVADEITIVTTERTFEIGETWDATISLGFEDNAKGKYNVAVTIIPLVAVV